MSLNDNSAEVAEDYRLALEDLTMNSRYEITNLTVVARENTEHAHAISEVLQEHIKKVPPQRKLPALYVLDSIVKNVGTPYTLFFGRKLYQTFMDAYASVDNMTRRKMDEMLKTWKEPVPGSIDTRPVFPPDVVRPIENALIKARTAALQVQQESMRGQHQLLSRGRPPIPYRDSPTPPDGRPGLQQGPAHGYPSYPGLDGNRQATPTLVQPPYSLPSNPAPQSQLPHRATPQPAASLIAQPAHHQTSTPEAYGAPQPQISIDQLGRDIEQVIAATKAAFAQSPLDTSIQTRLRALLDLQSLIQHQNLHQDQLVLVKNQVAELAVNIRVPKPQQPPALVPTPPVISQRPTPVPPVTAVGSSPPPASSAPPAPVSLDSLFGQGALATLLAGAKVPSPLQVSPTPPPALPQARAPPTPQTQPGSLAAAVAAAVAATGPRPSSAQPPKSSVSLPTDPASLLAVLRQSGLIQPSSNSATSSSTPANASSLPLSVPQGSNSDGLPGNADIDLKPSSLKQFRPHLIPLLYDELGPQCTQCGRRFRTDEEGRRRKTAHMDWHFRVHQRVAEAEKRGQHRSWYVPETEWVKSREAVDVDYVAPQQESHGSGEGDHNGGSGRASGVAKLQYIPVPEDSRTNTVCPICQEKFEMKWLDEAQEWVWVDAVKVGQRVYHASCYAEATRDRETTPGLSRNTPEPVLGKRKAEQDEYPAMKAKIKLENE
ncbi:hypothetical protein VTK73DRAFT_7014 [Phialemonium thermophilum]|uniref:CID domain-containing protein n=1 Tax=Phialemonium thermophilum TaxID=223376 RepID=A0ABR3XTQ3_9PEZI